MKKLDFKAVTKGIPSGKFLAAAKGPMFYLGSETATVGNAREYRVKDAAIYYIGKI